MTRPASKGHARTQRSNIYDEITTKIIAELEAGRLPWVQPWGSSTVSAPLAMPRNAATDRGYSGINVLILWGAVVQHGFATQGWLTFRQALGLGGNVRKGEHGTTVVYADRFIPDDERRRAQDNGDDPAAIPFLKRFTVFNVAQCEGLPDGLSAPPPPIPEGLIVPEVEALIRASGADLRLGGDKAFPFNKLVLSQSNVRRIKSGVSIEDLAEDIARRTLLQSLNVRAVVDAEGNETGMFEVPAGGRRYRALERLVKQKRLSRTAPASGPRCVVADVDHLRCGSTRGTVRPLRQLQRQRRPPVLEPGRQAETC